MKPAPQEISTCSNCGGVLEETFGGGPGCMFCLLHAGIGSEEETVHDSTPDSLESGVRFGVYEIDCHADGNLCELGRGSMGVTYRATDTSLRRKVALKIIKTDIAERSADARERFVREARAAAALRHEHIATVYQFGTRLETGQYFYAMELIEGETLDERVHRAGPLDARSTIGIAQQVTSALAAAEKHGLVHRDLKPANLMLVNADDPEVMGSDQARSKRSRIHALRKSGIPVVKIIDFGLAKAFHTATDPKSLTHDRFVGTPAFASPEQFEHAALDVRSDIYSLGETLWFALTGKTPFGGRSVEEIHRAQKSNVLPIEQLKAAHVPSRLRSLLESMLAFEPASRPGTSELAARLQRCSPEARTARRTRVTLAAAALLILSASAAIVFLSVRTQNSISNLGAPEKSIAVLPFENRSEDKANAYFADGIQDEILTRLSKIADLKVISRTSTQRYQSKPGNLAEIAKQLGVANILEGSVQKAGDQVRVNVQLVNAQSDSHLWAETYDRKLTDIFSVESEIAKGIAESLQAKLTGREEQALAVKPTNNSEAYEAYLHGLAFEARSGVEEAAAKKAIGSYERAVQLDPNFAIAWARLSRAYALLYFAGDATATRRDATKSALDSAQKLEPNSPETLLALGYYQYWVLRDYASAKATFGRVSKMLPSSSEVPRALALIARREGNWNQSIAYYEQALILDPRNVRFLVEAAWTDAALRQFSAALKLYDRVQDTLPNEPGAMASTASIYQAEGNLQQAARLVSEITAQTPSELDFMVKITQLRLERNYGEAVRLLQARITQFHFLFPLNKADAQVWLALTQLLAGDMAGSKLTAEQARNTLELLCKDQQDKVPAGAEIIARELVNASCVANLSLSDAVLENKELALKEAERAVMLLRHIKDPVAAPSFDENLALVQTILGETSRPISTLMELLQTPYFGALYGPAPITPALLRLDPLWDPLRADPAFQKLFEEKQPVAPEVLTQSALEKSIAVLAFENLSEEKANAYFADGIQEEILTRLAKIADLKVISRTSTQKYKSNPDNLREIAKQLGVANILEGSVQKAGDQVRVNVQLINAATDVHLWAETYDRKLTDIFGVESEIAKGIAEALQAKLTGREEQALAVKPTNNPEAYDAYLRGRAFQGRGPVALAQKAAGFYEQAVQLDPTFALAWAWLSRANASVYFTSGGKNVARRDGVKKALENAERLQPNLPETQLALGYYQFQVLGDYALAKTTFRLVSKTLPGSSEVPYALGLIAENEGNWNESVAYFEQGLTLDPRNVDLLKQAAFTYAWLRQFPMALKLYDRALDIIPNDPETMAFKAAVYHAQGNLQEAAKLLSERNAQHPSENASASASVTVLRHLRLERNHAELVRLLQTQLAQFHFDSEFTKGFAQVNLAFAQYFGGDSAGAKVTAERARNTLEPLCKSEPNNAMFARMLSLSYAALGNKDSAINEAERAIMLSQSANDRMDGSRAEENLAVIQAMFGENNRAISTLSRLLQTAYGSSLCNPMPLTRAFLRLDPFWDPLRADPAFQKLCEEKQN